MENHHVYWDNSLQTAMFNSYVKLPECRPNMTHSKTSWLEMYASFHGKAGNSHFSSESLESNSGDPEGLYYLRFLLIGEGGRLVWFSNI